MTTFLIQPIGTVEIAGARQDNAVRVTVADHGPGIPASFHARIFQKFAQADSSDTREKGGTGLGLAITRELVERMGGRIGFDSEEGEGARFFFELPLSNAGLDSAVAAAQFPSQRPGAARILVVEDDPDIARLLGLMLARAGYAVDTAGSGREAVRALGDVRYAAMTLDLMLPDTHGLDLIRQVRQRAETADLPIIVVSARMEAGRLAIASEFSGVDWVAKPIDQKRLLALVEKHLPQLAGLRPRILHVEDDEAEPALRLGGVQGGAAGGVRTGLSAGGEPAACGGWRWTRCRPKIDPILRDAPRQTSP